MLVAQAVFAVEKFKNITIPYEKIDDIFKDILNQKQNVVLIGMPGSGKSTAGKFLSNDLNVDFIDTDALITEKYGNISDIFANVGESGFREIEADIIKEIATLQGKVISTGGGAVLRHENIEFLKQNGKIYFLDRPLELITATTDRPLSQTKQALEQRYNERYEIYCNSCDKRIISNGTVQDTVNEIKGDFLK
jgi:shikimate dehydrogenase